MKVKSAQVADQNYRNSIAAVPGKYASGIQATNNWQEKTIAGEALYAEKVQEAIAAQRRAKAVAAVSNEDWKNKALKLGQARIAQGMTENAGKRAKNWEPYRQTLEATSLPERTADPMQNVTNRVGAVVSALVAKKKEIKG